MTEQMLVLIAPEQLKDDIIDTLISMDEISGFNLLTINGYSKQHSQYNIAEQVAGYRQLYKFEVVFNVADKDILLSTLAPVCQSTKLKYWLLPVIASGHWQ